MKSVADKQIQIWHLINDMCRPVTAVCVSWTAGEAQSEISGEAEQANEDVLKNETSIKPLKNNHCNQVFLAIWLTKYYSLDYASQSTYFPFLQL